MNKFLNITSHIFSDIIKKTAVFLLLMLLVQVVVISFAYQMSGEIAPYYDYLNFVNINLMFAFSLLAVILICYISLNSYKKCGIYTLFSLDVPKYYIPLVYGAIVLINLILTVVMEVLAVIVAYPFVLLSFDESKFRFNIMPSRVNELFAAMASNDTLRVILPDNIYTITLFVVSIIFIVSTVVFAALSEKGKDTAFIVKLVISIVLFTAVINGLSSCEIDRDFFFHLIIFAMIIYSNIKEIYSAVYKRDNL